jgi:uncharacterized protein YndB with AHSA1/START domain
VSTATETLHFTVKIQVNKPVREVYEAIVDPHKLSTFFTETASGWLEPDTTVKWTWEGGIESDTHVEHVVREQRITLSWKAFEVDYDTQCEFKFEPSEDGKSTTVHVTESGWQKDEKGYASSYEHCSGWTHMLLSLKARLEHDIDLR